MINVIILSLTSCIDSFLICILNKNRKKYNYFLIPTVFSIFQSSFLLFGYFFGDFLENYLQNHLKYIIFIIFSSMALRLIVDVLVNKGKEVVHIFSFKDIFFLSIITSGDAMFLGVPLAFSANSYINLIIIISLTTFFVCLTGLLIRNKLRNICDDKIQIIGSIVLFIFAFKSLI